MLDGDPDPLGPWWYCPVCGFDIQCPRDIIKGAQCLDCKASYREGRLTPKQAEFYRVAAVLRNAPDPLLIQLVEQSKGAPHPLHPDDPSDGGAVRGVVHTCVLTPFPFPHHAERIDPRAECYWIQGVRYCLRCGSSLEP